MKEKNLRRLTCLLGHDPEKHPLCSPAKCHGCGWNKQEAVYRRLLLRENGLTLCPDGLRRLVISRETEKKEEIQ